MWYARSVLDFHSVAVWWHRRWVRALYESFGFVYGEPFGDYKPDPNSVFMWLAL